MHELEFSDVQFYLHAHLVPRHWASLLKSTHKNWKRKGRIYLNAFAFVAFLVSVHGAASIGGENLKSPAAKKLSG